MANISQTTFFNAVFERKIDILIMISLKFIPKGPIDNNSVLVQVWAWHGTACKSKVES